MKYWLKYLKPYRKQAITGFIFKSIEAFLELMIPMVVAHIIDVGIANNDRGYIIKMIVVMFLLGAAGYACAVVCQYFASLSANGFGRGIRRDMYHSINSLDYDQLDSLGTPTLITRLTTDIIQLQMAITWLIRLVSRNPLLIIGSLIMAFMINRQVATIFLVIAPLIALALFFVMSRTQPIYTIINKILDQVSLITRENLSGVRVIRAFRKEQQERTRFKKATNNQKTAQLRAGRIAALLNPATTVIVNVGIILILYVGAIKVNTGSLKQGEVIALVNYMNAILLSLYAFSDVILTFIKANISYQRVAQILDMTPHIKEGTKEAPSTYEHLVTFNDVSFSYAQAQALDHLSFNIDKGQTIGIIGGTGSGKSTLVNLIPRFYEATEGQVLIKGQNIKDYTFEALRSKIGLVPQQAILFSGSIRENLKWGNRHVTDEEMMEALRLSQSEFVFDLPKGLDTMIEQGGKNVSGGQRQRLTIARALVKQPELLILDDSASALDFATDAKLRKALKTIDTTTIIVSQRVSALMHADQIIVLDHGHMAGIGNHESLLKDCDIYKEIVHSQIEGDQNEE